MLSRVKGQVSGSRGGSPFGAGELEREVTEPVERSPCGPTTAEPAKRTARDPATSTATKTSTKRRGRFRSSFGLVVFRRMLETVLVAIRGTSVWGDYAVTFGSLHTPLCTVVEDCYRISE